MVQFPVLSVGVRISSRSGHRLGQVCVECSSGLDRLRLHGCAAFLPAAGVHGKGRRSGIFGTKSLSAIELRWCMRWLAACNQRLVLAIPPTGASPARHWSAGRGWPLLQLVCLALIVAAPGRCGGLRGQHARRRRRGPEGLRAASGAQARNVSPERAARYLARTTPCPDQRNLRREPSGGLDKGRRPVRCLAVGLPLACPLEPEEGRREGSLVKPAAVCPQISGARQRALEIVEKVVTTWTTPVV
jgi:hypothetical protein